MTSPGGFGGLLRSCRLAAGLTQREVAERAGISLAAVRDLEQGRSGRPRPRTVRALIGAVGVTGAVVAEMLACSANGGSSTAGRAHRPAGPITGPLRIGVLGPLTVRCGAAEVWVSGKGRAVLARLALSANTAVPVGDLVDLLWPVHPPKVPVGAVQAHVSRLRRAVGPGRSDVDRDGWLQQTPGGYRLVMGEDQLDVTEFHRAMRTARRAGIRPEEALAALESGLGLWRGEPLADVPEMRHHPLTTTLVEERLAAASRYGDLARRVGSPDRALPLLRALAMAYPLHEPLHAGLIAALAAAGRRAEALSTFDDIRRRLADELGVDPDAQLAEAHRLALRQRTTAVAGSVAARPAGRGGATGSSAHAPRLPFRPAQLPPEVRFSGRRRELRRLDDLREVADRRTTAFVTVVSGPAGIGKTALAVHWAHRVRDRFPDGQLFADLRGVHPTRPPTAPEDVIRTFLDALGVSADRVPTTPEGQLALYRSLLDQARLLIVLDNAHDAEQVRPLLPAGRGCTAVVTSRSALAGLVAIDGADPVVLGLLSTDEARELLAARLGHARVDAEQPAVNEIIDRCGRLPLALAIAAARAATGPAVRLADIAHHLRRAGLDGLTAGDPRSDVRAAFSWSYRALNGDAARLFRLFGLLPWSQVSLTTVASLAGLPLSRARPALAELSGAHLLSEPIPDRFAMHDLLHAYAAELVALVDDDATRQAAVDRALDHYVHTARSAALLLTPGRDPVFLRPPRPGVIGPDLADDRAALAWLTTEHTALLDAIDLAESTGRDVTVWQLGWALEYYLQRCGRWQQQVATQRAALRATGRLGDMSARARAARGLARAYVWLGRYGDAAAALTESVELCNRSGDVTGSAHAHLDLSLLHERQRDYAGAASHAEHARRVFRAADDRAGVARATNMLGWCQAMLGNLAAALAHCELAVSEFVSIGDRAGQANALDSLARARHRAGDHRRAVAGYERSLALFLETGDRYGAAQALTHLGEVHRETGADEAARAAWARALTILDDLEHVDAAAIRTLLDDRSRKR